MNLLPDYQLFVYGSLRRGFHHAAYEYIRRYFDFVCDARVHGLLFDMGEFPAAVPAETDATIVGELYRIREIDELDWALGQLDDYEGVNPEENEPLLYRRDKTTVLLPDGTKTTAWIYWFNGDITGKPIIASGDVLKYVSGN
ncbi:gamma-glutamylcyclotransferase family protein [Flavihumibacter fluvii]|uniref:gamma-glutamylcyclotransferase family protein n=1 Tax=Flavihumibacter fluvii TaxID=2838157 RepID=UPI001BDDE1E8|nr:gamma-glutamylcyclotransferase family protein [Flavihumibacter fluvii]ULQ51226.1 gamma-glutamylcyclotransferase [Flavihumibacter fluvii]